MNNVMTLEKCTRAVSGRDWKIKSETMYLRRLVIMNCNCILCKNSNIATSFRINEISKTSGWEMLRKNLLIMIYTFFISAPWNEKETEIHGRSWGYLCSLKYSYSQGATFVILTMYTDRAFQLCISFWDVIARNQRFDWNSFIWCCHIPAMFTYK